jgi:hydroxymethylbilane synthase
MKQLKQKRRNEKHMIVGSRTSELALLQTKLIIEQLEKVCPDYTFSIKEINTRGDKILDVALSAIGDKGLFTKELEIAMIDEEIDMAVHSLKDLPSALPKGLTLGAVSFREKPNDVLIGQNTFDMLPSGARVGTSSLRRKAQLKRLRPDLNYIDIRGNLNTRLRKLEEGHYEAIILAYAGIKRLNKDHLIVETFDTDSIIPAVGQGVLAIECLDSDSELLYQLKKINNINVRAIINAERTFLKDLQGGCQVPLGAIACREEGQIKITGFVADLEGKRYYRHSVRHIDPIDAGLILASHLRSQGADVVLQEIRDNLN